MKINCDVCEKAEASIFCSADEAALCDSCDRHVHHANKLATRHSRFLILHPSSSKHSPLCDICQERQACLFCREDRAILCEECDIGIHRVNEQTKKHNRYLLTGATLSSCCCSSVYRHPSSSSSSSYSGPKKNNDNNNMSGNFSTNLSVETPTLTTPTYSENENDNSTTSTSNISKFVTSECFDTLPSWRIDDSLDPYEAYWKGVNVETLEHLFSWGI